MEEKFYHHHLSTTTLEVTVLSADSLKKPSSLFSRRLRPYVVLSLSTTATDLDHHHHHHHLPPYTSADPTTTDIHRTRVDEHGADNPTWGDTLRLPFNAAAVDLFVLSKSNCLAGPTGLGWCRIPASDVADDSHPPGTLRRLTYALRDCRHGGRAHGVVHVAVRLLAVGPTIAAPLPPARPIMGVPPAEGGWWSGQVVVGVPAPAGRKDRGGCRGCVSRERMRPSLFPPAGSLVSPSFYLADARDFSFPRQETRPQRQGAY